MHGLSSGPTKQSSFLPWDSIASQTGESASAESLSIQTKARVSIHTLSQARQLSVQIHALEWIARHRREGVLRSELSKALGMDAKAFHYVATVSWLPSCMILL